MRTYAFLRNNIVASVQEISDEEFVSINSQYELAVDISDYIITPVPGYILSGNKLIPAPGQELTMKEIVKCRIKLYRSRAKDLLVDLYATNTLSGMTTPQSEASFELHGDVIFCLNEGAWPTAIYRINKKVLSGAITQETADVWIALIQANL